jgi:hypothetical protein
VVSRDGVPLGPVDYDLEVWQDFIIAMDQDDLPGAKESTIRLSNHKIHLFTLRTDDATLTLNLDDGRQIDIIPAGTGFVSSGEPRRRR